MIIANEARSAALAIIISYPTRAHGIIVNYFLGASSFLAFFNDFSLILFCGFDVPVVGQGQVFLRIRRRVTCL